MFASNFKVCGMPLHEYLVIYLLNCIITELYACSFCNFLISKFLSAVS
jgi:hypothetical protein